MHSRPMENNNGFRQKSDAKTSGQKGDEKQNTSNASPLSALMNAHRKAGNYNGEAGRQQHLPK